MRKRRVFTAGLLLSALLSCAGCANGEGNVLPPVKEEIPAASAAEEETAAEAETGKEQAGEEEGFQPELPFHAGIWEADEYGEVIRWYEFREDNSGAVAWPDTEKRQAFTYTDLGDGMVRFDTEDGEAVATVRFGEDGKHAVLTFDDRKRVLRWVSHGNLDDLGGFGVSLAVYDVTPEGAELVLTQSGGYLTGTLMACDAYEVVHLYEDGSFGIREPVGAGWEEGFAVEGEYRWELTFDPPLSPGTYAIRKVLKDERDPGGDWDKFPYYAWFTLTE